MKKTKANPKVECLRNWADTTIENLIRMEKEGKDKAFRHEYLKLSMQAGGLMETVLDRSGNVDVVVEAFSKGKLPPTEDQTPKAEQKE